MHNPEVVKIKVTTTSVTIKCLLSIFTGLNLPEQFVTDNVPKWTSEELSKVYKNNVQVFKMFAYQFDLDHSVITMVVNLTNLVN